MVKNQQKIELEKAKLTKVFSGIQDKKKKTIEKLINNAAFMSVLLEELADEIAENGYMCKYQNGANQWGEKESPSSALYNKTISNYTKIIKQLTDLIPEEITLDPRDEILDYM